MRAILKDAHSMDELGPCLAGDLTGAEVRYLVENEWAQTADDYCGGEASSACSRSKQQVAALERLMASMKTNLRQ